MPSPYKLSRCFLGLLTGTALFLCVPAHAKDAPPSPPTHGDHGAMAGAGHKGHPLTLEEARTRAKTRLDNLNGMSEADWKKHQEERRKMREKWQAMSPEEKAAAKEKMQKTRAEHGGKMKPGADGEAPPPPPPGDDVPPPPPPHQ